MFWIYSGIVSRLLIVLTSQPRPQIAVRLRQASRLDDSSGGVRHVGVDLVQWTSMFWSWAPDLACM